MGICKRLAMFKTRLKEVLQAGSSVGRDVRLCRCELRIQSSNQGRALVTVFIAWADMVRDGFATRAPGIAAPSTTYRPGSVSVDPGGLLPSNTLPNSSTTPLELS